MPADPSVTLARPAPSQDEIAAAAGLSPIGVRPPLSDYVRQLWGRRHFIWFDARKRAATENSRNALGNLWLVLRPLLDAGFYFVIFGLVLQMTRGMENFPAFLVIGILMFRATAASIANGSGLIRSNRAMVRAFVFPRAAIPVSNVLRNAITAMYTMAVMLAVIVLLPPHVIPTITWALIVPIFALQVLMNLGITLVTARLGFLFPDISNVLTLISRFLMYGSGVMFPIERFVDHAGARAVIELNPLYQLISMARTVLMDGAVPPVQSWLIVGGWTAALLLGGLVFFWRGEERYGSEFR